MEMKPEWAATAVETPGLRYLEPVRLHFCRHGARLRLTIEGQCSYLDIAVVRAFPLTEPQRYLSLRDQENKEIGIIADPAALATDSRHLVQEELERRYLLPVIRRVLAVKERFEVAEWTVETDRGVRTFTTRDLRENTLRPSPGRYLLGDVDGNRYDVRDLRALDRASQIWLLRYL